MFLFLIFINCTIACIALSWSTPLSYTETIQSDSIVLHSKRGHKHVLRCETNAYDAEIMLIDSPSVYMELWWQQEWYMKGDRNMSSRHTILSIPDNNYAAYKMNERVLTCRSGNQSCFMQFNVEFEPFVDVLVSRNQYGGIVTCPIRAADNFTMEWSLSDKRQVLSGGIRSKSSFYYVLGNVNANITCSLIKEGTVIKTAYIKHNAHTDNLMLIFVCLISAFLIFGMLIRCALRVLFCARFIKFIREQQLS